MNDIYDSKINNYYIGVIYRIKDKAIVNCYRTESETMSAFSQLPEVSGLDWRMLNIGLYLCSLIETENSLREYKDIEKKWKEERSAS